MLLDDSGLSDLSVRQLVDDAQLERCPFVIREQRERLIERLAWREPVLGLRVAVLAR